MKHNTRHQGGRRGEMRASGGAEGRAGDGRGERRRGWAFWVGAVGHGKFWVPDCLLVRDPNEGMGLPFGLELLGIVLGHDQHEPIF